MADKLQMVYNPLQKGFIRGLLWFKNAYNPRLNFSEGWGILPPIRLPGMTNFAAYSGLNLITTA
jgi:hypothetical protein